MIYIVNSKYYYKTFSEAVAQAKNILEKRATAPINHNFIISKGKNGGYCVALDDDWRKVGNINLLRVIIRTVKMERI